MADLRITHHAVARYQERIPNLPDGEVRARLSTRAIQAAAEFGAHYVRLCTGHRVVIVDGAVITVLEGKYRHKPSRRMHPGGIA